MSNNYFTSVKTQYGGPGGNNGMSNMRGMIHGSMAPSASNSSVVQLFSSGARRNSFFGFILCDQLRKWNCISLMWNCLCWWSLCWWLDMVFVSIFASIVVSCTLTLLCFHIILEQLWSVFNPIEGRCGRILRPFPTYSKVWITWEFYLGIFSAVDFY